MESTEFSLLTVEQFAERMQVSRTTVFTWLKNGELQESVHYLRLGRVLRFRWQEDLFFNSRPPVARSDAGTNAPPPPARRPHDSQRGAAPVNSPPLPFSWGNAPAMNLDYG
jgi:excisionase family DNA binding protein